MKVNYKDIVYEIKKKFAKFVLCTTDYLEISSDLNNLVKVSFIGINSLPSTCCKRGSATADSPFSKALKVVAHFFKKSSSPLGYDGVAPLRLCHSIYSSTETMRKVIGRPRISANMSLIAEMVIGVKPVRRRVSCLWPPYIVVMK